jgi:hypothetical protein
MTAVYWDIGQRIVMSEQGGEQRAGYGEQLVEQRSHDLTRQFGRGFVRANLWQNARVLHSLAGGTGPPEGDSLDEGSLDEGSPGEDSPDTDSPDTVWRIRKPSQDARG